MNQLLQKLSETNQFQLEQLKNINNNQEGMFKFFLKMIIVALDFAYSEKQNAFEIGYRLGKGEITEETAWKLLTSNLTNA